MQQKNNSPTIHFIAQGRFSFSLSDLLGKGATGNVYKGLDHKQNKSVAIKVIETGKMNQVEKSLIENQKKALKIIKHANIMKLYHIEDQHNFTFIISEIYEGGSLKQYLQKKGSFDEQQAMEFFRKIVLGYCAVVQANIIHRDLKPTNILLTKENEPVIIDFGYSQIIVANKNLTVFNVGSPSYMSPEAYNKTIYSEKSDVWSLGAIFYELLMNTTLDQNIPTKQYFQSLLNSEHPPIINFDLFGQVTKEILKGTLAVKPQQRITTHRIKYLLDKEILGKKFCHKVMVKAHSYQEGQQKQTYDNKNCKSMKNFEFLVKEVDFAKLKEEQEMKNMKRKPMTTKTFSNFPLSSNDRSSLKSIPLTPEQFIQGLIKNESQKKVADKQSFPQNQPSKTSSNNKSLNMTPSASRIEFRPADGNKNSMSTISYMQKRGDDGSNKNIESNLVLGSKEASKNMSMLNMSNLPPKNVQAYTKRFDDPYGFKASNNTSTITNNEYFNSSVKDHKNLTYNQGFYNPRMSNNTKNNPHNFSLSGSIEKPSAFKNSTEIPVFYSDQIPSYVNRTPAYQRDPLHQKDQFINTLLNLSQNKKSSKRLSYTGDLKQKPLNQCRTIETYEQSKPYVPNQIAEKFMPKAHPNENVRSQLTFKMPQQQSSYIDMRQMQQRNNSYKYKGPQNTYQTYTKIPPQEKVHQYQFQAPKSYQDLYSKPYQSTQNSPYQKAHFPPKSCNLNQSSSLNQAPYPSVDRMEACNTGENWYNKQLVSGMHYQEGPIISRNSSDSGSKKIISLRKLI